MSFKGALSRYSVIFVDFLRQKNGADPTKAAPDQTNRGVRASRSKSRDSACRNGSKTKSRRAAIRPSCEGELKSSCFSSSCSAEVPSSFFLVLDWRRWQRSRVTSLSFLALAHSLRLSPLHQQRLAKPDLCQHACRRSCNIGPLKSLHRSSTQIRIVRSTATMENRTAAIIFPHKKMAQKITE